MEPGLVQLATEWDLDHLATEEQLKASGMSRSLDARKYEIRVRVW
jgi:hypothetical protein|tara:strand:- start:15578 stop:15712 length:135 start_codon:yes stop_codon:yes gene_type:complete